MFVFLRRNRVLPMFALCGNFVSCCSGGGDDDGSQAEADRPKAERFIRPFSISSTAKVKLAPDARLYSDQSLAYTAKDKRPICTDRVAIDKLATFVDQMEPDMVQRTLTNRNNTQTTKIIQNLYITSFGGLKAKTLKNYRVNLLLNASVDLPIVDVPNTESIRVPITEKEPDSLTVYVNDVADKIQENYLKNGQTVIYCVDGNRNSVALSIGYLLKYTDLQLSEALLHLQYSRKGFEQMNGNLGAFKKPIENFAKKLKKLDSGGKSGSSSISGDAKSSTKKAAPTSNTKKSKKD